MIVRPASSWSRARPKSVIQRLPWTSSKQVGRLDVAVDDAELVRVVERLGGLDAQRGDRSAVLAGTGGRGGEPVALRRVGASAGIGDLRSVGPAGSGDSRRTSGARGHPPGWGIFPHRGEGLLSLIRPSGPPSPVTGEGARSPGLAEGGGASIRRRSAIAWARVWPSMNCIA